MNDQKSTGWTQEELEQMAKMLAGAIVDYHNSPEFKALLPKKPRKKRVKRKKQPLK